MRTKPRKITLTGWTGFLFNTSQLNALIPSAWIFFQHKLSTLCCHQKQELVSISQITPQMFAKFFYLFELAISRPAWCTTLLWANSYSAFTSAPLIQSNGHIPSQRRVGAAAGGWLHCVYLSIECRPVYDKKIPAWHAMQVKSNVSTAISHTLFCMPLQIWEARGIV